MSHHFCFSLCVLTRTTAPHLFCLVHEKKNRGWWLPGGAMDDGETFVTAGLREAKEEAGADVVNPRLLRVEQTPNRIRYIVHGQVEDPATLKSKPDAESMGAQWFTLEDVKAIGRRALLAIPECFLRGSEPLEFFDYVEGGGPTFSVEEFFSLRAEAGAFRFDKRWAYATTLEARLIIPAGPGAAPRVVVVPASSSVPCGCQRLGLPKATSLPLARHWRPSTERASWALRCSSTTCTATARQSLALSLCARPRTRRTRRLRRAIAQTRSTPWLCPTLPEAKSCLCRAWRTRNARQCASMECGYI